VRKGSDLSENEIKGSKTGEEKRKIELEGVRRKSYSISFVANVAKLLNELDSH